MQLNYNENILQINLLWKKTPHYPSVIRDHKCVKVLVWLTPTEILSIRIMRHVVYGGLYSRHSIYSLLPSPDTGSN